MARRHLDRSHRVRGTRTGTTAANVANVVGAAIVALVASPAVVTQPNVYDAALRGDRAVLSLLPDDVRSGRYTFHFESKQYDVKSVPRWSGVFWRTPDGNVYTRAEPYDEELVTREVSALMERELREREESRRRAEAARRATPTPTPTEPVDDIDVEEMLPLLSGTFYRGSEFQYPLHDLLAGALVPDLDSTALTNDAPCEAAIDAHADAIRRAVNALEPKFTPAGERERWSIPLNPLRLDTMSTRVAAMVSCGEDDGPSDTDDGSSSLVFERHRGGLAWWWVTPEGRTRERRVTVTPGPVGPPPALPDPAPRNAVLNDFLLAVAACGELPWEYSNFAAGHSFRPPGSRYYDGPTLFSGDWVCEEDVPAHERADPD